MNISPRDLYEMAKSLKRVCSRLDDLKPEFQDLSVKVIADIFNILFLWIQTPHLERWNIEAPECWTGDEDHTCTIFDVKQFCTKLLQGIRHDQVSTIVEQYAEGAGFGSREDGKGVFDVEKDVDAFIEMISPETLDEIVFTDGDMIHSVEDSAKRYKNLKNLTMNLREIKEGIQPSFVPKKVILTLYAHW